MDLLKYVKTFHWMITQAELIRFGKAAADMQALKPTRGHLKDQSSGPRTRSQSFDADIKTYSTRRKSLATRKMSSSEVDLNAPDTSFIKVLSDDDSDDNSDPLFWHIFAVWEVIPTG
ncbi:hypothetical protein Tco_1235343 [Tanacetum coccineum]